jgi:hypothetical protein
VPLFDRKDEDREGQHVEVISDDQAEGSGLGVEGHGYTSRVRRTEAEPVEDRAKSKYRSAGGGGRGVLELLLYGDAIVVQF